MQNSVTHEKECCPYQTQMTCHSNTHTKRFQSSALCTSSANSPTWKRNYSSTGINIRKKDMCSDPAGLGAGQQAGGCFNRTADTMRRCKAGPRIDG